MSENIIPLGSSSRTPATSDPRHSSRSTATAPAAGARKRKGMDEEALAELQRQEREEDSSSDDEEPAAPPRKMPKGKGKGTETKNVGKGKGRGKKEKPEKTPKATQPTEPPVITPPGKGYGTVQLKLATTFFFNNFYRYFLQFWLYNNVKALLHVISGHTSNFQGDLLVLRAANLGVKQRWRMIMWRQPRRNQAEARALQPNTVAATLQFGTFQPLD